MHVLEFTAGPMSLAQLLCDSLTFFPFPVGAEGQAWLSEHLRGKVVMCKVARSVDTYLHFSCPHLADCPGVAGLERAVLVLAAWLG